MRPLSDRDVLGLQVAALFTHDPRGRICYVNEPRGDRAPRFFFGRTREGNIWRCRDDLDEGTLRELQRLAEDEPVRDDLRAEPRNLPGFLAALRGEPRSTPESARYHAGPAYRFPAEVIPATVTVTQVRRSSLHLLQRLPWNLPATARDFERYEPFMAVVEDGVAVSLCHSSRLTARAAEAGVETLPAYRGRGYASAVVAAWAQAIQATGRVPLYSTAWANLASQAVARRLGLIQYATDLSLP